MPVYPPPPPIRLDQGGNDFLGGAMSLVNMLESQREDEQLRQLREQQNQRAQAQESREAAMFPARQRQASAQAEGAEVSLRGQQRQELADLASQDKIRGLTMDAVRELDTPARQVIEAVTAQGGPRTPDEAKKFAEAQQVIEQTDAFNPASPMYNPALVETAAMTGNVVGLPPMVASAVSKRIVESDVGKKLDYDFQVQRLANAEQQGELLAQEMTKLDLQISALRAGTGKPGATAKDLDKIVGRIGTLTGQLADAQDDRMEYISGAALSNPSIRALKEEYEAATGQKVTPTSRFWDSPQVLSADPLLMARTQSVEKLGQILGDFSGEYDRITRGIPQVELDGSPKPGAQPDSEEEMVREQQRMLRDRAASLSLGEALRTAERAAVSGDMGAARAVFEGAGVPLEPSQALAFAAREGLSPEATDELMRLLQAVVGDGPYAERDIPFSQMTPRQMRDEAVGAVTGALGQADGVGGTIRDIYRKSPVGYGLRGGPLPYLLGEAEPKSAFRDIQ